jgi:uncharacterized membrane protein
MVEAISRLAYTSSPQEGKERPMRPTDGQEPAKTIDASRTEAFSDGVFAIAATLLVLNLEVPRGSAAEELPGAVAGLAADAFSYALSFLVILAFWMAHRAIFRHISDVNRRLGWLNGLFLMVIASVPFSTGLFDAYPQAPLSVVVYAGTLAVARLLLTAVWWYASADSTLMRGVGGQEARFHRARGLAISLVFALSIGVAYVSVWAAVVVWIALFVADHTLLRAHERRR